MGVGGGRGVKEVGETVAASLEVIVGEDSDNVWHTLVSSKAICKRFPSEADVEKYVDSALESLTECYNTDISKLSTQCSVLVLFVSLQKEVVFSLSGVDELMGT